MKLMHAVLATALLSFTSTAFGITADELVARNLQAKGGATALKAVHSLRRSGRLIVNQGQFTLDYVEILARDMGVRYEIGLQGLTQVQAYDGKEGWQIDPFQGRKDPERMPDDDLKPLIEQADIDGPLVDFRAKGHTLEYLGTEDIDGTPAHKLKLTRANGDVSYWYLDPDYFLEIRIESQRSVRGVKQTTVTDLGNYEQVGGVYYAFAIESGPKGSSDRQMIEYDKIEVNPPIDAAVFAFPARH